MGKGNKKGVASWRFQNYIIIAKATNVSFFWEREPKYRSISGLKKGFEIFDKNEHKRHANDRLKQEIEAKEKIDRLKVEEALETPVLETGPDPCLRYLTDKELVIFEVHRNFILPFLSCLKQDALVQAETLVDLICSDLDLKINELDDFGELTEIPRFDVTYVLRSLKYGTNFIIKTRVGGIEQGNHRLNSVNDLYKSAGWAEREIGEIFGILFEEHPEPKRLLTDYGFEGFPLRKEFPLTGYSELLYDHIKKGLGVRALTNPIYGELDEQWVRGSSRSLKSLEMFDFSSTAKVNDLYYFFLRRGGAKAINIVPEGDDKGFYFY